eukprot:1362318-Amorphochlora_amoeboformis.AAC.1
MNRHGRRSGGNMEEREGGLDDYPGQYNRSHPPTELTSATYVPYSIPSLLHPTSRPFPALPTAPIGQLAPSDVLCDSPA